MVSFSLFLSSQQACALSTSLRWMTAESFQRQELNSHTGVVRGSQSWTLVEFLSLSVYMVQPRELAQVPCPPPLCSCLPKIFHTSCSLVSHPSCAFCTDSPPFFTLGEYAQQRHVMPVHSFPPASVSSISLLSLEISLGLCASSNSLLGLFFGGFFSSESMAAIFN